MIASLPVDIATRNTLKYLQGKFEFSGSRLLEVGCGNGELAAALLNEGVDLLAIDIDDNAVAKTSSLGVKTRKADILAFSEPSAFDVVLFSRCLHHIQPLPDAVRSAKANLKKGGLLIAEEFAPEVADERSISWLTHVEQLLIAAGALNTNKNEHCANLSPLEWWQHHHFAVHNLSTAAEMLTAINAEFNSVELETCPYLYRYIVRHLSADDRGAQLAQQVLLWESELIARGDIKAVGRRFVAS